MSKEKAYKLKVNFSQGEFEAEGTKEFVEQKYAEFKEIRQKEGLLLTSKVGGKESLSSPSAKKRSGKKKSSVKNRKISIIKDLNLKPKGKESLKDFYDKKAPDTNLKRNAVFVYYLKEVLKYEKPITINHIYTCYKGLGLKLPKNIFQSIADATSNRYGYIDTSSGEDGIKLSTIGDNLVNHYLPIKKKN